MLEPFSISSFAICLGIGEDREDPDSVSMGSFFASTYSLFWISLFEKQTGILISRFLMNHESSFFQFSGCSFGKWTLSFCNWCSIELKAEIYCSRYLWGPQLYLCRRLILSGLSRSTSATKLYIAVLNTSISNYIDRGTLLTCLIVPCNPVNSLVSSLVEQTDVYDTHTLNQAIMARREAFLFTNGKL